MGQRRRRRHRHRRARPLRRAGDHPRRADPADPPTPAAILMRRLGWMLLASVWLAPAVLAQGARVSVSMALNATPEGNGARKPIVYLRGLLNDSRWNQALDNSLPIVLNYHLEVWRSRDGWI